MDAQTIKALQADIVRAIAGNVADVMDGEWGARIWRHLFVDFECDPGGRSSSISFALAHVPGGPVEKIAFRLPPEARALLAQLADEMAGEGGAPWTSAQIRIEQNGRFAFTFGYDPPWRLGGNLIDKRFEDYCARWLDDNPERAMPPSEAKPGWLGRLFGGKS